MLQHAAQVQRGVTLAVVRLDGHLSECRKLAVRDEPHRQHGRNTDRRGGSSPTRDKAPPFYSLGTGGVAPPPCMAAPGPIG